MFDPDPRFMRSTCSGRESHGHRPGRRRRTRGVENDKNEHRNTNTKGQKHEHEREAPAECGCLQCPMGSGKGIPASASVVTELRTPLWRGRTLSLPSFPKSGGRGSVCSPVVGERTHTHTHTHKHYDMSMLVLW